ncbi:MAG: VWA domain-containing protein [Candidatus Sumerlaeaceae bacterium]|nr:VWA domain-containing protein [Candidatus Sumerlaeaceae bacterium]
MQFLAPFGFAFAAALPVIVTFYLLKLRRSRQDVSCTMLWRRAAEDLHANAPFQKLRRNLLLLLQLIIAALMVLGLARPYLNLATGRAKAAVLLIDKSASMDTTDESANRSRLEVARERAIKYINDMAPGDRAMIVEFADKANVLVQFSADKSRLEQAVRGIRPTNLPTVAQDAFSLAQSLAKPENAALVVFSDGAFPAGNIRLNGDVRCEFQGVGQRCRNAGITALDVRRPPENTKEYQVFATVRNFSAEPMDARLEVTNRGSLIDAKPLQIAPQAEASQIFTSAQLAEGEVELRLVTTDDLAADNTACAVIKPPAVRKLLVVTGGNYFLDRALRRNAGQLYDIATVTPALYSPTTKADVIIFDNFAPPGPLAAGSYFFINARPPVDGFTDSGSEDTPLIFDWDNSHPVMRYVELGEVLIRRARKFTLPSATQILAESKDTPLISVYSSGNRNIVLWSFDVFESNLPLRVAFPILVANSLEWLMRNAAATETAASSTGQILQMDAPNNLRRAAMKDPTGQDWILTPNSAGRLLFDRTGHVGFYKAEIDGKSAGEFGVSLINAAESDVTPQETLNLQNASVTALRGEARSNREIWKWFALGALAIVLLEWVVYHKRIWV